MWFGVLLLMLVPLAVVAGLLLSGQLPGLGGGLTKPKPIAIAARRLDKELELELADGSCYRSEYGVIWYIFPSGQRVNSDWNDHLELEWERRTRLDRWSKETEK